MSEQHCAHCQNSGLSAQARELHSRWFWSSTFKPEDRQSTPFLPTDPKILAIAKHSLTVRLRHEGKTASAHDDEISQEAERLCMIYNSSWQHHLNADDVAVLCEQNRLLEFTHVFENQSWTPKQPACIPTPAEVNAWSLHGLGHDAINRMICIMAECKRLSVPYACEHCGQPR